MQLLVVITSINHVNVELKGFMPSHPYTVGQINPDNAILMLLQLAFAAVFLHSDWFSWMLLTLCSIQEGLIDLERAMR